MIEKQLAQLFKHYIKALNDFNVGDMLKCCTIPCVLHTPDKIAYLPDEILFTAEFTQIFQLLQSADVVKIHPTASSYAEINPQLFIVSINWEFLDSNNEVYTDFSAFYHVSSQDDDFKITNVISHELANAVLLEQVLRLTES